MLKREKGITLIALVITIIVMIILAAVVISIIMNGGLFKQANDAKEAQEKATLDEQAEMVAATARITKESNDKGLFLNIQEAVKGTPFEGGVTDNGDGTVTIKDSTGKEYIIDSNYNVSDKKPEEPILKGSSSESL